MRVVDEAVRRTADAGPRRREIAGRRRLFRFRCSPSKRSQLCHQLFGRVRPLVRHGTDFDAG
jgi:hypothetical protein